MAEPTWGPRLEAIQAEAHAMLGQEAPLEAIADRMDDLGASWEDMLRVFLLGRWTEWKAADARVLVSWLKPRFPLWADRFEADRFDWHQQADAASRLAQRLPAAEAGLRHAPETFSRVSVSGYSGRDAHLMHAPRSADHPPLFCRKGEAAEGIGQGGGSKIVDGPCWLAPTPFYAGWVWLLVHGLPASMLEEDVRVEGAGDGLVLRLAVLDAWRPPPEGSILFHEKGQPEGRLCLDSDFLTLASWKRIALAIGTEGRAIKAMPMPLFQMGSPVWAVGTGYLAPIPRREGEEPFGYVMRAPDSEGRAQVRVTGWPGVQELLEVRIADCYR